MDSVQNASYFDIAPLFNALSDQDKHFVTRIISNLLKSNENSDDLSTVTHTETSQKDHERWNRMMAIRDKMAEPIEINPKEEYHNFLEQKYADFI